MTLLAPWALWFLIVGGGVVALYLLKIKRRQAVVPALDFWLQLAGRTKVHSLWERLKRLLSMLLWLLIVACLVLALGNPILSLGRTKPRAIAVIIDNSASMQALETDSEGKTRLQLAQQAVEELTGRRPVTDEWLLIEAAREARVLVPWTVETKAIRRAAADVKAFAGTADLSGAVSLAGQLVVGKTDPCIVVISDGAAGSVATLASADSRVMHWPVGRTSDNLGIGRLSVRAHRQQGNYHALISVVNGSEEKVDAQVVLEVNGTARSVELVSVEAHGVWEKTIVVEPDEGTTGGVLRAVLDRADVLAQDNEAYAVLEPIRPAVVWLVTRPESAFFFEHALGSMDTLVLPEESLTLAPEQFDRALAALEAPPEGAPKIKRPDLIVFNGWTPAALPRTGRFVLVNTWSKDIPATVRGEIEAPQLFLAPRPHPVTQHVTFQGARLAKAQRITLNEPATVLASSADGDPLVVLVDQPDRQALCLAFDVLQSDLPFRNAFPLLLRNAVAAMHHEAASWLRSEYQIGEPVRSTRPLPAGAQSVTLGVQREGKAVESTLEVKDGRVAFTDTGRAGAIRMTAADETCFAVVNLGAPDESRIGVTPPEEDAAKKLSLSGRLFGALPWVGLVFVAVVFIALEWLTYHFRWTE